MRLPIGSVVLLPESDPVMVTGYFYTDPDNYDKLWDYCGIPYPEGITSDSKTFMFDHEQIKSVLFTGYMGEDYEYLMAKFDFLVGLWEKE